MIIIINIIIIITMIIMLIYSFNLNSHSSIFYHNLVIIWMMLDSTVSLCLTFELLRFIFWVVRQLIQKLLFEDVLTKWYFAWLTWISLMIFWLLNSLSPGCINSITVTPFNLNWWRRLYTLLTIVYRVKLKTWKNRQLFCFSMKYLTRSLLLIHEGIKSKILTSNSKQLTKLTSRVSSH